MVPPFKGLLCLFRGGAHVPTSVPDHKSTRYLIREMVPKCTVVKLRYTRKHIRIVGFPRNVGVVFCKAYCINVSPCLGEFTVDAYRFGRCCNQNS